MDKIITKEMLTDDADSNITLIVNEVDSHKNELILNGWQVCLLLDGVADDGQDYYYRLIVPNEGILYHSCVGRLTYLKGKIGDDDYNYLYDIFKMNWHLWNLRKQNKIDENYEIGMKSLKDFVKEMNGIFADTNDDTKK